MKKMFCFAFLVAALGVAFQTAAVPQAEQKAAVTATSAIATDDRVLDFRTGTLVSSSESARVQTQSLPSCGNYDGNACSTPGTSFRCQWQPYEPGRCFCGSNKVWTCG